MGPALVPRSIAAPPAAGGLIDLFRLPGESRADVERERRDRARADAAADEAWAHDPRRRRPWSNTGATADVRFLRRPAPCDTCGVAISSGRDQVRIRDRGATSWRCRACALASDDPAVVACGSRAAVPPSGGGRAA